MQTKAPSHELASGRPTRARPVTAARGATQAALNVSPRTTSPWKPAQSSGARSILAKAVGSYVPSLTKPAFERYGFSAATVITDWATIVGADIARYTMPERLKWPKRVEWSGDDVADADRGRPGATLILAVASGRALDVQYKCGQLVERINAYFGYRAIADIRIVQVPAIKPQAAGRLPMPVAATPVPAPPPRQELVGIAEPSLRAALERMAEGLIARKSQTPTTA